MSAYTPITDEADLARIRYIRNMLVKHTIELDALNRKYTNCGEIDSAASYCQDAGECLEELVG